MIYPYPWTRCAHYPRCTRFFYPTGEHHLTCDSCAPIFNPLFLNQRARSCTGCESPHQLVGDTLTYTFETNSFGRRSFGLTKCAHYPNCRLLFEQEHVFHLVCESCSRVTPVRMGWGRVGVNSAGWGMPPKCVGCRPMRQ